MSKVEVYAWKVEGSNCFSPTLEKLTLPNRSFSEMWCLPRAVHYLESRKVDVRGILSHKFRLKQFDKALQSMG